MSKKIRLVEMYVGYTDKTWDTSYVSIPQDTPKSLIEKVSMKQALKKHKKKDNISFIGIYNMSPDVDFLIIRKPKWNQS